jgi:hypothetical protein
MEEWRRKRSFGIQKAPSSLKKRGLANAYTSSYLSDPHEEICRN